MNIARARQLAQEIQLHQPSPGVGFHGLSMRPFLEDGDQLTVDSVQWDELRAGDIVTYRLDDRFPTLRIVRKHPTKVILRGDGWPFADFEAWPEDILGRVTARRRRDSTLTAGDWRWITHTRLVLADDRARRAKRWSVAFGRRVEEPYGAGPCAGYVVTTCHRWCKSMWPRPATSPAKCVRIFPCTTTAGTCGR